MATTVPIVVPTVTEAAAAFLDTCTAPSTRRSYTQTMTRLTTGHGTAPVTALDGETLRELLTTSWSGAAPATWNRHLATLGSLPPTPSPAMARGQPGNRAAAAQGDHRPYPQHRPGRAAAAVRPARRPATGAHPVADALRDRRPR